MAMQFELTHASMLPRLLEVLHWIAGFIVLSEGLNKLHRCDPLQPGIGLRARVVVLFKVAAWICLVVGAFGALLRPFVMAQIGGDLHLGPVRVTDQVSLSDVLCLGGFALLIVRSRFKETLHAQQPQPQ
jgi:hypothetical protein